MSLPLAWSLTVDRQGVGRAAQSEHSRQLAPRLRDAEMTQSICSYCRGRLRPAGHRGGEVIQIEGDPDSPISRGATLPQVAPSGHWAWPMNRRIIFNRASADPRGWPWSERKACLLPARRSGGPRTVAQPLDTTRDLGGMWKAAGRDRGGSAATLARGSR